MIKILPRNDIRVLVKQNPGIHDCIVIYEPGREAEVAEILPNCRSHLALGFHDITMARNDAIEPQPKHIWEALNWASDKQDIYVACRAGVSRSSAIAYLIACTRMTPEQAVLILDPDRHIPNELLIKHGSRILGEHIIDPLRPYYEAVVGYCIL
jgi:predicted protein tyrosine phosphatase